MREGLKILLIAIAASLLLALDLEAGISVEPTVTEKVLEAGATETGKYTVTNMGKNKLDILIEVEDWMGRLFGVADDLPVNQWLILGGKQLVLKPGESAELAYTVKAPVPFDKEKVAQVFFTFDETQDLKSRLGVIFYLSPKGTDGLKAEILELTANSEMVKAKPKLRLWFQIKNESDVHIRPVGSLTIRDEAKQATVKELLMNRVPGIYPGRTFSWSQLLEVENLPPGSYQVKLTLDYGHTYGKTFLMEKTAALRWEAGKEPSS